VGLAETGPGGCLPRSAHGQASAAGTSSHWHCTASAAGQTREAALMASRDRRRGSSSDQRPWRSDAGLKRTDRLVGWA